MSPTARQLLPRGESHGLGPWFALLHPAYRGMVLAIVMLGGLIALYGYAENALLARIAGSFEPDAAISGWLLLGGFACVRIVRATTDYGHRLLLGRLRVESWSDAEAQILSHLLRMPDEFFLSHPPAEVVTRLSADVSRASERRVHIMQLVSLAGILVADLVFFFGQSVVLGIVAVLVVVAGGGSLQWFLRPVQALDATFMSRNDRVKAAFTEYLAAVSEIQVGNLHDGVQSTFRAFQDLRDAVFHQFMRRNALLAGIDGATGLAAFLVLVGVVLWLQSGGMDTAAPLLPVVIWTLPRLYSSASRGVDLRLQIQLADTSIERLLEYESPEPDEERLRLVEPSATGTVSVEEAAFRYPGPTGGLQGGILGISVDLRPGRWVAIVGSSGSGKSTLARLLLGRMAPQRGQVTVGDAPPALLDGHSSGRVFSFMPQKPVLFDLSLRDNIVFGRIGEEPAELSAEDLELIDEAGVGRLACQRALNERPVSGERALSEQIASLRLAVRARLKDAGVRIRPYETGGADPAHWLLECLLDGHADRDAVRELLGTRSTHRLLGKLARTAAGARLDAAVDHVLRWSGQLLEIQDYDEFCALSPNPVPRPDWSLRRKVLAANRAWGDPPAAVERMMVALTIQPVELEPGEAEWWLAVVRDDVPGTEVLVDLFSKHCPVFEMDRVHRHLQWRSNLVFGSMAFRNERQRHQADRLILEFIEGRGLGRDFAELGLEAPVGRAGDRLSGGQRQLVALCRTLLRRTPVTVLDEPTAALDPASRQKVAHLLRRWVGDRLLVTITHDAQLVAAADQVLVLEAGELVAAGTPGEVRQTSAYQRVFGR